MQQSRLDERNAAAAAAGTKQLVAEEDSDSDGGERRPDLIEVENT